MLSGTVLMCSLRGSDTWLVYHGLQLLDELTVRPRRLTTFQGVSPVEVHVCCSPSTCVMAIS